MREEIVEQLGVTPTPGGLQKLLEQNETDRLNSDSEDYSLGSLYDESIESMEGAGIGRILPTKYNPAAQGVAGISALISKIMMGGSMDKFNELGDPEDINFSPTGMADGGLADLLNQDDGFGDEESYQQSLEEQAMIFAKSSPDNWDYEEALDNMAMNIAGGHRLEKSDVIQDLEQAIAERRVIEGTPDGLSFRDRFKEKFGMEGGGIVSLAGGGQPRFPALREFGNTVKSATPGILMNIATGGVSGLVNKLSQFGKTVAKQNKQNRPIANPIDAPTEGGGKKDGEAGGESSGPYYNDGVAGTTGAAALMRMASGVYKHPGGKNAAKGAGGGIGQTQRMRKKEQRKINKRAKMYDMFGNEQSYLDQGYPPEQAKYYADTFNEMHGSGQSYQDTMATGNFGTRGVGVGTIQERRDMGQDVEDAIADSTGRPANWDEIYAHYKDTGSWEGAPSPGGG